MKQTQADQELRDKIKESVISGLEKTIDRTRADLRFLRKFKDEYPDKLIELQDRIVAIQKTAYGLDGKISLAEKQLSFAKRKLITITALLPVKERIDRMISKLRRLGWTDAQIADLD